MRFLFLAVFYLFYSVSYAADNYKLMINASGFTQHKSISIGNMQVTYSGSNERDEASILYHVSQAYMLLDSFYQNPDTCRNTSLRIYHVDQSVIDNREIMHFIDWRPIGNQSLYGFYDARTSPRGTASIFVRKSSNSQFTIDTIVHEVAHHYQYTHCIEQSEQSAYSFERFYRDRTT